MKKQIVSACALIASVAAFATSVTSANTFGVLKVTSTATDEAAAQLIIPVPWENVGASTGMIDPTAYVLATNRKKGDALFYYNPALKTYMVWEMSDDGDKSGEWTAKSTYSVGENENIVIVDAEGSFSRGQAIILSLTAGSVDDVFLSGQYTGTQVATALTAPSPNAHSYWKTFTLIAPSVVNDIDLNSEQSYFYRDSGCTTPVTESDISGDQIVLADGTTYYCEFSGGKLSWYKLVEATEEPKVMSHNTDNIKLLKGQGAWYVRSVHSAENAAQTIYVKW